MVRRRRAYVIQCQLRLPLEWLERIAELPPGESNTAFVEDAVRRLIDSYPRPTAGLMRRIAAERVIAKPAAALYLELCGPLVNRIRELVGRYNTGHFLRLAVRQRLAL